MSSSSVIIVTINQCLRNANSGFGRIQAGFFFHIIKYHKINSIALAGCFGCGQNHNPCLPKFAVPMQCVLSHVPSRCLHLPGMKKPPRTPSLQRCSIIVGKRVFKTFPKTFNFIGGPLFQIFQIKLHLNKLGPANTPVIRSSQYFQFQNLHSGC